MTEDQIDAAQREYESKLAPECSVVGCSDEAAYVFYVGLVLHTPCEDHYREMYASGAERQVVAA